jgi:uncharacterized protein
MKSEIFFLPYSDGEILYAPLKNFTAVVNSDTKAAVVRKLRNLPLHDSEQSVIAALENHGIFNDDYKQPQVDEVFAPARVTLFPTDSCNLRCSYCYASAEEGKHKMPISVAKAAIDLVATNAKNKNFGEFSVGFHGNGEPFVAFDVIQEICDYVDTAGERENLKYSISTATNGVMSEECLDYTIAWITDVNVSSDKIGRAHV